MRRHDLDWIRVLVFALLIIYHVGMFFVPWGWHIKNNVISDDMRWPMLFVNQWRLASLFLISGMGTRFALSKRTSTQYVTERIKRLFIPLVIGMILIVPPQVYVERVVYNEYTASFWYFLMNDAFTPVYPEGNLSWHHLWFLPYLLLFSLLLTPIFIYLRNNTEAQWLKWQRTKLADRPSFLYIYMVPLFLAEALIEPFFPVTHGFVDDWFTMVFFIIIFFYGFNFIAVGEVFWTAIGRLKKMALFLGVFFFAAYLIIIHQEDNIYIHFTEAAIKMANMWSWMIVIFGYGAHYLNRPSAILTYCNQAVYPFYIFHQTITVLIAFYLYDLDLSILVKLLILVVGTFGISWILYELTRRSRVLRPLFGMK